MTTEDNILKTMDIGRLRRRVTIMVPQITKTVRGDRKTTYTAGPVVWAAVQTRASQIFTTTVEVNIIQKVMIIMRYRKDLTPSHRYVADGRTYKAIGAPVDAGMRHRWTYVECIEDVSDNGQEA
jgi:SPP1 family predicted phage head-tail adaptor